MGLFNTSFEYLHVTPTRPAVGEVVTITAKATFHQTPLCWWKPLDGRKIWLLVDDRKATYTLTDQDGVATFTYSFDSPGTYRVQAVYEGDWDMNPSQSPVVYVEVISAQQKREETRNFMLIAIVGLVAICGVISAYFLAK
jgi:hypothetical protein